jgi:hypothetical protein
MASPDTAARRAFLAALYRRVGDSAADQKTTVMDYVGKDLGLTTPETDEMVDLLMKAGLVTPPTKERVIGLTDVGLAVVRRGEVPDDPADDSY